MQVKKKKELNCLYYVSQVYNDNIEELRGTQVKNVFQLINRIFGNDYYCSTNLIVVADTFVNNIPLISNIPLSNLNTNTLIRQHDQLPTDYYSTNQRSSASSKYSFLTTKILSRVPFKY